VGCQKPWKPAETVARLLSKQQPYPLLLKNCNGNELLDDTSKFNDMEVQDVVTLAEQFCSLIPDASVGIITFFNAQVKKN
jgi:superfamily I DNA and/or RNA helicase